MTSGMDDAGRRLLRTLTGGPTRRRRGARRPPLLFRGWLVVAGAFLVQMAGFGAAYSFAAFADTLEHAFGTSHAAISTIYALAGFTAFSLSALSGPIADRLGPRLPVAVGMLLVGLGLLLAATAASFLEVLLCYGLLIGIGIGFAYAPSVVAVQRWFIRWRGLASGIAAAGIGVGTALVPPAAGALLQLGDWRLAFVVSGLVLGAIGLGGALLLAPPPESQGLLPDAMSPARARRLPPEPAVPAGQGALWRQRDFQLLYAACLLTSVPLGLPFAHLVAFAEDRGLPWAEALQLLGLVGIGSIAGRFVLGALADTLGRRRTFLACCIGVAACMGAWAAATGWGDLASFATGFGVLYGGFVALLPAVAVDLFGRRPAGRVVGLLYTARGIGLLAGPVLAAGMAETLGPTLPITLATMLAIAGTGLFALTTPRDPAGGSEPLAPQLRPQPAGGGQPGHAQVAQQ